ncbi:hypothetical protein Tco_0750097 [Tanacetum coccineum]|uniref:Uncharacterized protein n=1 Tax=Tanacetum coccineum TaxID=301880 RepID=A0ABQ4Z1C8_9ASTR
MYCDNTGAIAIANESGITKGARHFRAKVHYLREVIEFGDIKLEKVHTDDNLADPFTKALAFPKHSELTRNIGMLPANKVNKHILPKQPELNCDMYNWVISKYGKPNTWTDSLFHSIADDVYIKYFEKAEPEIAQPEKAEGETTEPKKSDVPECSKKADVQECSNIKEKQDQQDVHPDTDVIEIGSSSSELECSSTSKLECSSTSESSSSDDSSSSELSSYVSSYDELSSSDESGCLEKSDEEEIDEDDDETDEQDDEIDEEAEDGKDDSDDELWSPKTIGTTTKKFSSPKIKGASSNSTSSTKKLVKRSEPIRNCIIGLANNKTWEMIVNKEFGVKKE